MWVPDLSRRSGPIAVAVADAIADAVQAGRLAAGDRLPPQRDLADALGIAVTTITRGYAEAERRGLVSGEVGRGTFVRAPAFSSKPEREPHAIDLSVNALLPHAHAAELIERFAAITRGLPASRLLDYQSHFGRPELRAAAADWVRRWGVDAPADELLLTVGAQHGLAAVFGALCAPGDEVLVDPLTYPGMKAVANYLRIRLKPVPVDRDGMLPDALAAAAVRGRARLLYCMPSVHNPTGTSMSARRRKELIAAVDRAGITVVEDDSYGFLAEKLTPLTAAMPERAIYVSGLSKSVVPGAPGRVRARAASARGTYCRFHLRHYRHGRRPDRRSGRHVDCRRHRGSHRPVETRRSEGESGAGPSSDQDAARIQSGKLTASLAGAAAAMDGRRLCPRSALARHHHYSCPRVCRGIGPAGGNTGLHRRGGRPPGHGQSAARARRARPRSTRRVQRGRLSSPARSSIHAVMRSSASRSCSTVPSGGICVDGRRDRIRTSIALRFGAPGVTNALAPSGACGICHFVVGRNSAVHGIVARRMRRLEARLQQQPERRDRALRVVAAAAVGREIAEHRARARVAARRSAAARRPAPAAPARARASSASVRSVIMSGASGSACSAFGSRSVESCSAVKPRISVRRAESWQARQSSPTECCGNLPGAISATFGSPSAGASIGVGLRLVPDVAREHPRARAPFFHRNRVSTLRPPNANSFQNRVPTGKSHRSTSRASIVAPSGSRTQRDFAAPSLQSGYCGENGRLRGSIASASPRRRRARSPTADAAAPTACARR